MLPVSLAEFLYIDALSVIIIFLICAINIVVYRFSINYMVGDIQYPTFFRHITQLTMFLIVIVVSNNLILFSIAMCLCNWVLLRLIVHKKEWEAARASGYMVMTKLNLAFFLMIVAFIAFYKNTGSVSMQYLIQHAAISYSMLMGLTILFIAVIVQTATWPFHRWLISSLNLPTPVSVLLQTSVINIGVLLLVRFSPLYQKIPFMPHIIVALGFISAVFGSFFELIQHDIKRTLAYSTLSHMGFILLQCGLGLFASAIAHLCYHSMYKAYLLLGSGGLVNEIKINSQEGNSLIVFTVSTITSLLGSCIFIAFIHENKTYFDTSLFMAAMVFTAIFHMSLTLQEYLNINISIIKSFFLSMMLSFFVSATYACSIQLFNSILSPVILNQPQLLNPFHVCILFFLSIVCYLSLWLRFRELDKHLPNWLLKLYVVSLNNSQPHPSSVTSHRKAYKYG